MKVERTYKIYAVDTDSSERKAATLLAKSEGHARAIAQRLGITKISAIVLVD